MANMRWIVLKTVLSDLGGHLLSIPLPEAVTILTTIAPSFGCGNVVDFHGAGQLSNQGILRTIISALG